MAILTGRVKTVHGRPSGLCCMFGSCMIKRQFGQWLGGGDHWHIACHHRTRVVAKSAKS
jgi:hypothetical protein